MNERRNDYSQEIFDEFVAKVGVPQYAAVVAFEDGGNVNILTNDKELFESVVSCGSFIRRFDMLRRGYSSIISEENLKTLELPVVLRNVMKVEGKVWSGKGGKVETSSTIFMATEKQSLRQALDSVCEVQRLRIGKGFMSLTSEDSKCGSVSVSLSVDNKNVTDKGFSAYNENGVYVLIDRLMDKLEEAQDQAE